MTATWRCETARGPQGSARACRGQDEVRGGDRLPAARSTSRSTVDLPSACRARCSWSLRACSPTIAASAPGSPAPDALARARARDRRRRAAGARSPSPSPAQFQEPGGQRSSTGGIAPSRPPARARCARRRPSIDRIRRAVPVPLARGIALCVGAGACGAARACRCPLHVARRTLNALHRTLSRGVDMREGLMMDDYPLSLTAIIERAERFNADRARSSPAGPTARSTAPRSATARVAPAASPARWPASASATATAVATLMWNQPEHLELYFAVPLDGRGDPHAQPAPAPRRARLHRRRRRGQGDRRRRVAAATCFESFHDGTATSST